MKLLITGVAGFIGYHTSKYFLDNKFTVYGIDNLNNYYDVNLKKDRLNLLLKFKNFHYFKIDLKNNKKLINSFNKIKITHIIHLSSQPGVRISVKSPNISFDNNIFSFLNIINFAKMKNTEHFIYASSSSVYGNQKKFPVNEKTNTDKPLSPYAATKKTNEIIAYSFANTYSLPCTGLRLFTVYGPYGRPDMALFKFTKNILENKKIHLYNRGDHMRDFTYIDDAVAGIVSLIDLPSKNKIPHNIYNIGNGNPRKLKDYLKLIEKKLNRKAKITKLPLQIGDVIKTHADINFLNKKTRYKPKISLEIGIEKFVDWYLKYYKY